MVGPLIVTDDTIADISFRTSGEFYLANNMALGSRLESILLLNYSQRIFFHGTTFWWKKAKAVKLKYLNGSIALDGWSIMTDDPIAGISFKRSGEFFLVNILT